MKSLEIVSLLDAYKKKIIQILGSDDLTISSAYSFIIVKGSNIHIQFEINDTSARLYELYPVDENLRSKIESETWAGLNSGIEGTLFSDEINKQLLSADSIALEAVNCTRGDDYRPGNFSKIILTKDSIELQQINHMNSRSLDHKTNYSLRSIIFKIDLRNSGELSIQFDDRSSANNRHCGDRIKEAINLAYPSQAKL